MTGVAQWGAFCFGLVIGWFVYLINRYRTGEVGLGDITTVIAAIGGGAVTALFGGGDGDLFGAYGIGLAAGFFGYLVVLAILVWKSPGFGVDFFLDGRRRTIANGEFIPDSVRQAPIAMDAPQRDA